MHKFVKMSVKNRITILKKVQTMTLNFDYLNLVV